MLELADDEVAKDVAALEDRLERAADLVADGIVPLADCEAHDIDDIDDEAFRDRVRELLDEDVGSDDEPDEETPDGQITTASAVDWQALWEEFGFHGPNAHGREHVSGTKLAEALRVTDQPITADSRGLIDDAVAADYLTTVNLVSDTVGDDVQVVTAGYRLVGGEQ
jgi:hypothetical protein